MGEGGDKVCDRVLDFQECCIFYSERSRFDSRVKKFVVFFVGNKKEKDHQALLLLFVFTVSVSTVLFFPLFSLSCVCFAFNPLSKKMFKVLDTTTFWIWIVYFPQPTRIV